MSDHFHAHTVETSLTLVKTLLCYDHADAGRQARAILARVETGFDTEIQFIIRLWRFDLLEIPQFREEATKEVAEADLFVFAFADAESLSHGFESFVKESLRHHDPGKMALAALPFAPAAGDPAALFPLRKLRALAELYDLAWLGPGGAQTGEDWQLPLHRIHREAGNFGFALGDVLDQLSHRS